ncbi:MAG TPA: hypothetical protein VF384_06060 [Planctomycetota bacterium]
MLLNSTFAPFAAETRPRVDRPRALQVVAADGGSADLAWKLLDSSGYLDETTPALRPMLADAYREYWRRVLPGGDDYLMLARSGQQPVGTLAVSRQCGGTWIWQHVGIDAGFRKRSAHAKNRTILAMYRTTAQLLLRDQRVRHLSITCARHKPFNVATYHAFATAYGDRMRCSVHDLAVHKIDPSTAAATGAAPAPRLSGSGWQELATWLRTRAPGAASAALELAGDPPCCAQRLGFAYRAHGRLAAAAVVEIAGLGSNLFGLRNSIRVFDLGLPANEREAATMALVHAALAEFRARGEREAVLFADADSMPPPEGLPFAAGIEAMHFAIAREALPAWIEYFGAMFTARLRESA